MKFKTNLAPILAYIYEIMHMTLKSSLIFSFDVSEWWSDIVFSDHVTSALNGIKFVTWLCGLGAAGSRGVYWFCRAELDYGCLRLCSC